MRTIGTRVLALFLCVPLLAQAIAPTERARIEALLARVESSSVFFIRNGTRHDARAAAAHLRMKWEKAGDHIGSAEAFIEKLASRSYLSGEPYRVVLGGRTLEAGPWLYSLLEELDAGTAGAPHARR